MPERPSADPPPGEPLSPQDLRAFVAAVDAGSVGGAADALDLTQSAVTKRLQRLERRLGVRLLDRGPAGVGPTEAGRVLHPEARRALQALRRVERTAAEHRDGADHDLVVAASHTIGDVLLPDWLGRFRAAHPGTHVQVEVVNSPGVLEAVRGGRAQIGFVEGLDPLDGLEHVEVARDEIVAVVAAGHRWAGRRAVAPAELARETYVAREAGSGTRAVAEAALAAVGVALRPAFEAASTGAVKRALRGGGFSLLSRLVLDDAGPAGDADLVPLVVRDVDLERALVACHLRGAPPEGAAGALWRLLVR